MKEYRVFVDEEVRGWQRAELSVQANSIEEIQDSLMEGTFLSDYDWNYEDSKYFDIEETLDWDFSNSYAKEIK